MVLAGEATKGFFDLVGACRAGYSQDCIIISFTRRHSENSFG
jgi:hypothetical protein